LSQGGVPPISGPPPPETADEVNWRYRKHALEAHPDRGGSQEDFERLTAEKDAALQNLASPVELIFVAEEAARRRQAAVASAQVVARAYVTRMRALRATFVALGLGCAGVGWAYATLGPHIILGKFPWPDGASTYALWGTSIGAWVAAALSTRALPYLEDAATQTTESLYEVDAFDITLNEVETVSKLGLMEFTLAELTSAVSLWVAARPRGIERIRAMLAVWLPTQSNPPAMRDLAAFVSSRDFSRLLIDTGIARGHLTSTLVKTGNVRVAKYTRAT